MNALITGVTGFAGSFLAEHLLACGDSVLGVSCWGRWPSFIPSQLAASVPLVCWDIATQRVPSAEAQYHIARFAPDCVYHLAAISVPADCGDVEPTPEALATNVHGTARVIQWAAGL